MEYILCQVLAKSALSPYKPLRGRHPDWPFTRKAEEVGGLVEVTQLLRGRAGTRAQKPQIWAFTTVLSFLLWAEREPPVLVLSTLGLADTELLRLCLNTSWNRKLI